MKCPSHLGGEMPITPRWWIAHHISVMKCPSYLGLLDDVAVLSDPQIDMFRCYQQETVSAVDGSSIGFHKSSLATPTTYKQQQAIKHFYGNTGATLRKSTVSKAA